jgi:hypothetical protein
MVLCWYEIFLQIVFSDQPCTIILQGQPKIPIIVFVLFVANEKRILLAFQESVCIISNELRMVRGS